jgi:hypothetical protein
MLKKMTMADWQLDSSTRQTRRLEKLQRTHRPSRRSIVDFDGSVGVVHAKRDLGLLRERFRWRYRRFARQNALTLK